MSRRYGGIHYEEDDLAGRALSLLRQDTSPGSLKGKRKRAAWNTDFLESLLFSSAA